MSYRENVTIISTSCLADGVYEMWLKTEKIAGEARPGQFISVYSNDGSRLLPRPISICRIDGDKLRIVYRIAGKGTKEFSQMSAGQTLDIQGPLGNGYDIKAIFDKVENVAVHECKDGVCTFKQEHRPVKKAILFGGGIGIPPMLRAIKEYAVNNNIPCYVSLEEKMACGIGACLACVCKSTEKDEHSQVNNKRVCKEGPVFDVKEVEL